MHAGTVEQTRTFIAAADAYGIGRIWTMTALENAAALRAAFPERFEFIAVPNWQSGGPNEPFISDWCRRLDAFYALGSRLIKFHQAPGTRVRWKMSLDHPLTRRVIKHAYELGYHFMTHVGDPKTWFLPGKPYADHAQFGTFEEQFPLLEQLLEEFPDRIHLGAHMGGSLEDLPALTKRLERFPNYVIDSSATKWIVRAIAEAAAGKEGDGGAGLSSMRDFFLKFQDRILFGSDIVVADRFNFDHYASRYWVHQMQWETLYRGESPIEDPDAVQPPQLVGLDLPPAVLEKIYRTNALRWLPRAWEGV
ncbi:MAG: amidohydrolase family protein [Phycisphaerae bacterium]